MDPPTFIKTINVTKDTATLVWNFCSDKNYCHIYKAICSCIAIKTEGSGYEIENSKVSFNISKDYQDDLKNFTIVMKNMSPYTYYECDAKTIGKDGESKWSNKVAILTAEDKPSSPIYFRYAGSIGHGERLFKWQPPLYLPGKLISYSLNFTWEPLYKVPTYCSNHNQDFYSDIDPIVNDFLYTSEETYAEYKAEIRTNTNAGWSEKSVVLFYNTSIGSKDNKLITVFLNLTMHIILFINNI